MHVVVVGRFRHQLIWCGGAIVFQGGWSYSDIWAYPKEAPDIGTVRILVYDWGIGVQTRLDIANVLL